MSPNEQLVRKLYQVAEEQDAAAFTALFTEDGWFHDVSTGVQYRGKDIGRPIDLDATAFPDMHRELYQLYEAGDTVIVELSLNGTHQGPLRGAAGTLAPTGREMHAPCCDVFQIRNGKVASFNCYNAGTIIFGQLGVLGNLDAAFEP